MEGAMDGQVGGKVRDTVLGESGLANDFLVGRGHYPGYSTETR